MKEKSITKSVLRVASVLLLVFALVKFQGLSVQAATTSYTETINGIEWKAGVSTDGSITVEPVTPSSLSGDIVIPETVDGYTVTCIPSRAFANCSKITSVQVPETVGVIGASAFTNCKKLTDITMPSGVRSIGALAFKNCTSLTAVTIPDTLTSIDSSAFNDCTYLAEINVDANNTNYCSVEGVLYNKSMTELVRFTEGNGGDYQVPEGVTKLANYAFSNCDSLTSVSLPDSLETISDYAFLGSSKIAKMIIPEQVTSIGVYAFSMCTSLADIEIGDQVQTIGYYAFTQCTSLVDVTLPASLKQLSGYTFDQCTNLKSVTVQGNVSNIVTTAFYKCTGLEAVNVADDNKYYASNSGVLFNKAGTNLIYFPSGIAGSYQVPDGVTTICSNAFLNVTNLSDITIPESVETIESSAFYNCSGLVTVNGGAGVTAIGANAFYKCQKLESITLSNVLKTIGSKAFIYCSALKEITIPASVTAIGSQALYYCTSMEEINVEDGNEVYSSVDGVLYDKAKTTVILCPTGWMSSTYVTPETVTTIQSYSFSSDSITEVKLSEGVTNVEAYAFSMCSNLRTVTLPASLSTIGYDAFYVPIDQGYDTVYYLGTTEQWNAMLQANSSDNLSGLENAENVYCLGDEAVEDDSSVSGEFVISSEWESGYNVTFTVTNHSETAINSWNVQFSSPDEITNIWSAEMTSYENGIYHISNTSWNGTIQPGESISFGFVMNKSNSAAITPEDVVVTTNE